MGNRSASAMRDVLQQMPRPLVQCCWCGRTDALAMGDLLASGVAMLQHK